MRRPEMRPRSLGGRALPAARELRVRVAEDGALVLQLPGSTAERLVEPGAATRVLFLSPADTLRLLGRRQSFGGAVVVLVGERVAAVLRLLDFAPPAGVDADTLRTTTGATALAGALGLPLEPPEPGDVERLDRGQLRAALVDPVPPPVRRGVVVLPLLLVAAVLAFLAWPAGGSPAALVLALLGLVVAAPAVLAHGSGRAEARRLMAAPLPAEDRQVVRPQPAGAARRWLADSQLQLGPQDVVLRDGWSECWLPGPAAGGVTTAVVSPAMVRLTDDGDRLLLALRAEQWCATAESQAALASACEQAGIRTVVAPLELGHAFRGEAVDVLAKATPSMLLEPSERGDITLGMPWFTTVVCLLLVGSALAVVAWNAPVGVAVLVAALALASVPVREGWARMRTDRAVRRLVPSATPVATP